MKCITIKNLLSVPILDGHHWDFQEDAAILRLADEQNSVFVEIALMDYGIPALSDIEQRYNWCHEWLVDYLRDVFGPPFTSNLAKVYGITWVGWQAVTSLGNEEFKGTRCIVANKVPIAVRISFPIRRDSSLVSEITAVLENIVFEETLQH